MAKKKSKKAGQSSKPDPSVDPIDDALRIATEEAQDASRCAAVDADLQRRRRLRHFEFPRLLDAVAGPLAGSVKTPWMDWDCTSAAALSATDPAYVDEVLPLWIAVGRAVHELGIAKEFLDGVGAASERWQRSEPGKNYRGVPYADSKEFDSVSYKAAGLIGLELWTLVVNGPWDGDELTESASAQLREHLLRVQSADLQVFMRVSHLPTVWIDASDGASRRSGVGEDDGWQEQPFPERVIKAAAYLLATPPAVGRTAKEVALKVGCSEEYVLRDVKKFLEPWGMTPHPNIGYVIPDARRPALRKHLGLPPAD